MHPHLPRHRRLRRRAALAGVAALIATGLVAGGGTSASGEPRDRLHAGLRSASDDLQTPFEKSNGARWTSVDEGEQFWRALDDRSKRVEVDRIGSTNEGRPLQLVRVGHPAPQSVDEAADHSVLMYNCSIHGDEPSGREACMQLARDLASSQHPAVKHVLRHTTVLFLNSNPDGWAADTRENANGVDVNRDFLALRTPEGRAIAETIRDWKPDVLNDLHEYTPREFYDTDLLHLWPRNRNVDSAVHRLAEQMNFHFSRPLVESRGHTAGVYGVLVKDGETFRQVAGDHQARILRNYSGLQHSVGMLSETANEPLTPEEEDDPAKLNRRRVDVNYTSAVGSVVMIATKRPWLHKQTERAAERATQEGATRSGVIYFGGQDTMLPTEAQQTDPTPMCGYRLNAEQLGSVRAAMDGHGIDWETTGDGGAFVTMAQPDKTIIPLLLDERAEYGLVEATQVDDC